MARNSGKSKETILKTAEKLFSKNGFDSTSVDSIAKESKVNKALIYYYFKSKKNLVNELFIKIISDLNKHIEQENTINIEEKIANEIKYLESKKDIISIILMESLKQNNNGDLLFTLVEKVSKHEYNKKNLSNKILIFEFFTGFMPLLSFVVYKKKWQRHFKCSEESLEKNFISFFKSTHIKSHRAP